MSEKIIWAVGDKVHVEGEKEPGTVTEVRPQIWGFNMYDVSVGGRMVRMVADKPALPQEAKEKAKLSNPPKAKFKTGERVVVKALKGTKSNEAVITLVGAAVPDENGKWSVGYQVQLVHNGQIVEYKESDLAGFKDCLLS